MNSKLKTIGIGLACLVCCLPLIFTVAGITTGAAGAVGYWLGRNEALIVAGIGLTYLVSDVIRHLRTPQPNHDTIPIPYRKDTDL